ncbi:MAG TPA: glycosyltransferase family 39 protein [Conexibacter sp.]|nr:glycosyltransferase family 39 protein [Conexibacter sp.]
MSSEGAWDVGGARAIGIATRRRVQIGWSGAAWGAIAVTAGFLALTCWWLAVDRSVQYSDAGQDLLVALQFRDLLADGALVQLIDHPNYYPPGVFVLGGLATLVGGGGATAPVLAQNLVFVPLLALSCYRTGRLVAGSLAGLLAVVFALGTPLLIEQFHVFMLDAPQAALVATSVWLVLESERFRRVGIAVLAGVALGAGVETKELAPLYLIALVACVLAHGGGWRNWRGLLAFAATAFAVGSPWYLRHVDRWASLLSAAGGGGFVPAAASPSPFSFDGVTWYGWATLNSLLLAPLFAFAAIGVVVAVVRVVRARPLDDPTLELLVGLGGAWTVLTLMPHHDLRYTMSLTIFLAVLATAWTVQLARPAKLIAIGLLLVAVAFAHLGATFGVGGTSERRLPGNRQAELGEGVPLRDRVVAYTNHNFLVSGPQAQGDVLQLLRAVHASGVRTLYWEDAVDESSPVFERIGVAAFALAVRLEVDIERTDFRGLRRDSVVAIRALSLDRAPPCIRLSDDTGVWLRRGDPTTPGARDFCPLRQPATYGP